MITKDNKDAALKLTQVHATDVGSPQAQVAVLTARIKEITTHLQANKHDFKATRGLLGLVGRRKRLLKYLENKDFSAYRDTITKLGLRK